VSRMTVLEHKVGAVVEVGVYCCSAEQAPDQRLSEHAVVVDIAGDIEDNASAAKEIGRLEIHLAGLEVEGVRLGSTAHSAEAVYASDSVVPNLHADKLGIGGH